MQIHIGDYSFRASQLEKCVAAMCSMWRRKPGAPKAVDECVTIISTCLIGTKWERKDG